MFHFKKRALTLLILLLALTLVACGGGESQPNEPPYDEDGSLQAVPPIGEIDDIDWSLVPVLVNGIGVLDSSFLLLGDDSVFPTHVSLVPVAQSLGIEVDISGTEVTLEGLNGTITFTVGSTTFEQDGAPIELAQPSVEESGVIYVPIPFFRDVFGAASAYFSGGNVFIYTQESDMQ